MKLIQSLTVAAAFAAAAVSSQAAAVGTANDLILGFKQLGAGNDVVINLSTVTNGFTLDTAATLAPGTYDLGNYASLISTLTGTVTWAAAGESSASAGSTAYLTNTWNKVGGTLGVANGAGFGTQASSVVNTSLGKINSLYTANVQGNLIANTITQSFSKNDPFNINASLVNNTFKGIGGTDANGHFAASDLYAVDAGVPSSTPGEFLGTLAVYDSGLVTFTVIPEPSTYAMILGALTIGFVALRRRFSKAV